MFEIAVGGINCPNCATKYACLMLDEAHVVWVNENWTGSTLHQIVIDESPFLQAQFGKPIKTIHIKIKKPQILIRNRVNIKYPVQYAENSHWGMRIYHGMLMFM